MYEDQMRQASYNRQMQESHDEQTTQQPVPEDGGGGGGDGGTGGLTRAQRLANQGGR